VLTNAVGHAPPVFDRAAVGARDGDCDRLAGGDLVESGDDDIALGGLDIGEAGRWVSSSAAIDPHDVGRGTRVIET